jgi:hypothetical protein
MALNNWNAGDVDYWDTGRRTPPPGEAATTETKSLGKITLGIGGCAILVVAVPLLLCLLLLIFPCGPGC